MYAVEPSGSTFETTPEGTHVARCYRFVDKGTHMESFQGAEPRPHRKVMFSWELPNELMADGRPFAIHKQYNWSFNEKSTLRKHLEGWLGRKLGPDDFKGPRRLHARNLLGLPCLVTVIHDHKPDGAVFAGVAGLSSIPKGMPVPEPVNRPVYLGLTQDGWDAAVFSSLSENLKAAISESPEYKQLFVSRDDLNDEIPFGKE